MDRGKLHDHPGAAWIIECARELFVSLLQQPEHIKIALMMTARGIHPNKLKFLKSALAEPLESQLSEFSKHPPVRFREVAGRHLIAV